MAEVPMPKLPGYTVDFPKQGPQYLAQSLTYKNGYALVNSAVPKPVEPPAPLPPADAVAPGSTELASTLPAWVAYDRKVLRFYAYFKEAVTEDRRENVRVRKCVIYFYLEDESIHVSEPRQENSGIPQGVFIKRHRIPKDASGAPYSAADFAVGGTVAFYGRVFGIVDADTFTRQFMANSGIEMDAPQAYPGEPIEDYRASLRKVRSGGPPKPRDDDLTRFMEARLGRASNVLVPDTLKQFLDNDGKVLRFYCVWDDRSSLYGDRRPYILHYFLSDDTVEILEVNEANSGRDPFPVMLKRARLPRGVFSTEMSRTSMISPDGYATALDFKIGATVAVYGRTFFIFDCDAFTRDYYVADLGVDAVDMEPLDVAEPVSEREAAPLPEYNGFGSLEDTKQNCTHLIPKPPKKDFKKQMHNEKKVLRFQARIVDDPSGESKVPVSGADRDRSFVLSYFLADDTLALYEPPARNSGVIGGKFLERASVDAPGRGSKYLAKDMHVGAVLCIHSRYFLLEEADDYTLQYMEEHSFDFPFSSLDEVSSLVNELAAGSEDFGDKLRTSFIETDTDGSGYLSGVELEAALLSAGVPVNKQQVVTLVRKFDMNGDGNIGIDEFLVFFGLKAPDA